MKPINPINVIFKMVKIIDHKVEETETFLRQLFNRYGIIGLIGFCSFFTLWSKEHLPPFFDSAGDAFVNSSKTVERLDSIDITLKELTHAIRELNQEKISWEEFIDIVEYCELHGIVIPNMDSKELERIHLLHQLRSKVNEK